MEKITSFSDKLLIQAAIDYSYRMSRYDIHENPVVEVKKLISQQFNNRYKVVLIENKPIKRIDEDGEEQTIQLRYLIIEDQAVSPLQHALIIQGSDSETETIFSGKDTDWSNNLSTAVHLPASNYQVAIDEYKYLKDLNKYNITAASGNSLGGGHVLSLAKVNQDLRIIGINPAPPTFKDKFLDSKNSIILYTSTDLLTRMLKTDISRYEDGDFKKIKALFTASDKTPKEKTKAFDDMVSELNYQMSYYYGVKTFLVERSLYYNDIMYIEAAHRGTVLEPREVALDILSKNLVAYSSSFASKIFTQTKHLIEYSRYFIKLSTNNISNKEYRDLVDNYIEPAFKEIHKNKLQDYRHFNSLATFIQYDLKSGDLINEAGITIWGDQDFLIDDHHQFIENLTSSLTAYKKSIQYPINRVIHDIEEEAYTSKKESDLNKVMTFFAASFNISLNFDLDIVAVFKGLPVTILFKIAELLDQNRRYLKGLKNDLLKYFSTKNTLLTNPNLISQYRNVFTSVNKVIIENTDTIVSNIEILKDNLNLVLEKDVSQALLFRQLEGKSVIKHFEDLSDLDIDYSLKQKVIADQGENLIVSQYNQILAIIDHYRITSVDELSLNIKKSEDIVKSSIDFIDKKVSKDDSYHLNKLSIQLKAMLENVDLATIYYNALNVFRHDIASIALRNTVGQSIITHYRQMIETNLQLSRMLENLKLYINENTSSIVRDKLMEDLLKIETDIYALNVFITSFIEEGD